MAYKKLCSKSGTKLEIDVSTRNVNHSVIFTLKDSLETVLEELEDEAVYSVSSQETECFIV